MYRFQYSRYLFILNLATTEEICGLSRIATQAEVDERRAKLERAFRIYGGNHGAIAIVPNEKAYAFIELHTERQVDLALHEMQDKYRLNRARLSRHEALQEERAAAEAAANDGQEKESSDWGWYECYRDCVQYRLATEEPKLIDDSL